MAPSFEQLNSQALPKAPSGHDKERRLQICLEAEKDNEARAVWRKNIHVPDADDTAQRDNQATLKTVFRFDQNFEPICAILQSKKHDLDAPGLFPDIEEIAMDTKTCIIFLPPNVKRSNGAPAVEIIGTRARIDEAKSRIRQWVREISPKTNAGSPWAKTPSLSDKQKRKDVRKMKKAYEKQQFRRDPDPSTSSEASARAYFEWPKPEIDPREVLGPKLEALDRIRTRCRCYITYVPDQALFEVVGKIEQVKEGVKRLRGSYYQVLAKGIVPDKMHFLQPISQNVEDAIVVLTPYASGAKDGRMVTNLSGAKDIPNGDQEHTKLYEDDLRSLKKAIFKSLQKTITSLTYYRGHISMKATLGTFILTTYKANKDCKYDLDEFVEMIGHDRFQGTISQGLSIAQTKQPLAQISNASPMFHLTTAAASTIFQDTTPVRTTTLIVKHKEVRFCLEFEHDLDVTSSKPSATKFSMLEEDNTGFAHIMDLYMINPDTSSAWHIHAKASSVFQSSQFPVLKRFTDKVKIHKGVLTHDSHPLLRVESMDTKSTRRYEIKDTTGGISGFPYICELSKIEHFRNKNEEAGKPAKYQLEEGYENLSILIDDWNVNFAKNAKLELGQGVNWKAEMPLWFPEDRDDEKNPIDGTTKLLSVLKDVERVVLG